MSDQTISPASPALLNDAARDWALPLFIALFGVALLPVLVTPIPAMVDYVNHLARMYLLVADGTPQASPYYRVAFALYPNLAMDLVVPRLARVMSVELATRTFLVASELLVVTGAMALERAVKGRVAVAGFLALPVLFSVPFAWGFVNFTFGLGIALWGLAAWFACRQRAWPARLALHALVCTLLFASHLFALGLYGAVLGLHELWAARARPVAPREIAGTLGLLAAPALALAALMRGTGGAVGQAGNTWFLAAKPFWFVGVLDGFSLALSVAATLALAVAGYLLGKRGALRIVGSGGWIAAGLAALYLAIPSRLLDTAFADLRVVVAAALILPTFVDIAFPSRAWRRGATGLVAAIVLAMAVQAAWVGLSYRGTYAAVIASFAHLERGAHVLVAHSGAAEDPPLADLSQYPIYHAPTLAAAYAGAFVPTLFTTEGKQPLSVRPDLRRLAFSCGGPVPIDALRQIAAGHAPASTPAFVRTWTRDYAYLYVVGPQAGNPLPERLELIQAEPRFTLYRIRTDTSG